MNFSYITYFINDVCEPSYSIYGICSEEADFAFFLSLDDSIYWYDESNWQD